MATNVKYLKENNLFEAHEHFMRLSEAYIPTMYPEEDIEEAGEDQDPNAMGGQDPMGGGAPMGGADPMGGGMPQDQNAMGGDPNAMGGQDPMAGGDPNAMGGVETQMQWEVLTQMVWVVKAQTQWEVLTLWLIWV